MRLYEVDLTVRETFTVVVEAVNAKEAAEIARYRGGELDTWSNGDRTISGVKGVRRRLDPSPVAREESSDER